MVVGVDLVVMPGRGEQLRGARGEDLVHIHVGGGPAAALEHGRGELLTMRAGDDFVGGRDERVRDALVEHAELAVRERGAALTWA